MSSSSGLMESPRQGAPRVGNWRSHSKRQPDQGALVPAEAPLAWVGVLVEKALEELTQDKIW